MGSSHTLSDDYPRKHMNVMRKSINSIAKFASTLLQYLNQTSLKNVEQQQYHLLQHLIQTATTTEFGKLHHFDDLLNEGCKYQTFQTTIPISHYEDFYEQRIERMLKGEQQLTTPHDISMFARTGGTTSKKEKYIPLTKQFLHKNQLSGPLSLLLFYQKEHPHSNLFAGKTITISGGFFPNPFTNAENVGFIS
ncbi:MAG: GH3 auxin-responsive promoter family protein [Candidatus Peribacteria bacterium]|jgi:hypothetical protein|nr:GH3 auxin-responsive promoter family protein [Candidatus Peribacteria bacterium]